METRIKYWKAVLLSARSEGSNVSFYWCSNQPSLKEDFLTLIFNTIHVDSTLKQSTLISVFYLS